MANAEHPTASNRPYVIDMFHTVLTTLPHGDAGGPEPQADADLAIDPALGSRIASLLSRLYFDREEISVTKKQPSGGKRTYGVRCLRHEYRGEEDPRRRTAFFVSVLRVASVRPNASKQHSAKTETGWFAVVRRREVDDLPS